MDAKKLIKKYLKQQYMMQLATVSDGKPWCCTVYYIADEQLNLYWASLPERRHSQDIAQNAHVAAAIPIKFVNGEKVIGIQVEGEAVEIINAAAIEPIAERYAEKFKRNGAWVRDFSNRRTSHKLYKLQPRAYVLFDDEHFPDDPRQQIII